ncbi:MAG: altronate dehydratase family protein [Bacteroidota bacterium]|nr:altronate dehydratase family protein [Bacteroidota bacterium]MDP4211020.1 altronate dehydratase family protein [Bacteroidota bacterium]MDP4248758.1 altronate dehydratase family protein [Bacteroidota bacterium]
MNNQVLKVNSADTVLVALKNLAAGSTVSYNGEMYTLKDAVPAKHKFFMRDEKAGNDIIMYGVLVGKTRMDVLAGNRLTTDNVKHAATPYDYRQREFHWTPPDVSGFRNRQFMGYHRSDGRVGTANYWLFIPTVFCENRNMDVIREVLQDELGYSVTEKYKAYTRELIRSHQEGKNLVDADFSHSSGNTRSALFQHVDGIRFLNHDGGCGGIRQDSAVLGNLLAAYANHPNVGGITLLSLGCQHLQTSDLLQDIKKVNPGFDKPFFIFEQQRSQSEEQLIAEAIRKTFEGLITINQFERKPASLDKLCIGVKCGGSDGFSGITANPAVGYCSDLLVALGGKVLLAEFPELNGVEQELIDRAVSEPVARKFIRLMKDYEAAAQRVGSGFDMNPSPGNIRDGLITDAMKSAGAAKKGGSSPVVDVLDYTEPATRAGLSLVCTPGNDVEATTGQAASGATLILFTTGLGTPTGNPVSPTIKISTNTPLVKRMGDIIDIDTGPIIEGEKTIEEMGEEILNYCIRAASGEVIPKAVLLNQNDFIPWKRGVSL